MSNQKEIDTDKIVDFVQILKNTYTLVVDSGGVELSVPEILLAVNSFHAAVVLSIERGDDNRPAKTQEEKRELNLKVTQMFLQALENE